MLIESHAQPIRRVVDMFYGSMPIDNGFLILEPADRNAILAEHPGAASCIRPVSGGDEYLNDKERFCLWLVDADPSVWMKVPAIVERVKGVKAFREARR